MPTAVAGRRLRGIALAIATRRPVTEIRTKNMPAQKTMPSAVGHGIFRPRIRPNVKKALMPMPGATA